MPQIHSSPNIHVLMSQRNKVYIIYIILISIQFSLKTTAAVLTAIVADNLLLHRQVSTVPHDSLNKLLVDCNASFVGAFMRTCNNTTVPRVTVAEFFF